MRFCCSSVLKQDLCSEIAGHRRLRQIIMFTSSCKLSDAYQTSLMSKNNKEQGVAAAAVEALVRQRLAGFIKTRKRLGLSRHLNNQ